jgi:hypothetical protein
MGYSTNARNAMLGQEATRALFGSLHSAFPGDTGANEIAGGVPPYARQAIAWGAPAGGQMLSTLNPTFNVAAGTTVAWLGLWTLAVAGTYEGCMPLGGTAGTPFYIDAASDMFRSDGHGLVNGQQVVLLDTNVGVLPGGFVEGTIYFVRDVAGDTFKLAAVAGGAAIDATTDGAGFVSPIVPETFGGQGSYAVSTVTLDLLR